MALIFLCLRLITPKIRNCTPQKGNKRSYHCTNMEWSPCLIPCFCHIWCLDLLKHAWDKKLFVYFSCYLHCLLWIALTWQPPHAANPLSPFPSIVNAFLRIEIKHGHRAVFLSKMLPAVKYSSIIHDVLYKWVCTRGINKINNIQSNAAISKGIYHRYNQYKRGTDILEHDYVQLLQGTKWCESSGQLFQRR